MASEVQRLWSVTLTYHNALLKDGWEDRAAAAAPDAEVTEEGGGVVSLRAVVSQSGSEPKPDFAVQEAVALGQNAMIAAGLTRSVPVRIEVDPVEGVNIDVFEGDAPALLVVAEIAKLLGVTKQRASEIAVSADFPPPAANLKAGPVWRKVDVARYMTRPRRSGRPMKTETTGQQLRRHLMEDAFMHSHTVSEDAQDRVFLWVCVPGPRGVTYILSRAQAEVIIDHFFGPDPSWQRTLAKSERHRKPSGQDITGYLQFQGWERRPGFVSPQVVPSAARS